MSGRAFSPTYDDSTDEKRQIGAEGERAVAEAVDGTLIDPADQEGDGYDGGVDVIAPDGTVIDVKTITEPDYRLLVRTERQQYSEADVYALVYDGTVLGALPAADVYDREPETIWRPMPPNDVYAVEQAALEPLEVVV